MEVCWIQPKHLGIKQKYVNEHLFFLAKNHFEKMDDERCPTDKLKCVQKAFTILNNCMIFCSGKNEGAGVDDLVPMLIYIIIKAKPKRMYSNFQYINVLLHPSKKLASYGSILTNIELSMQYITELGPESLKMSKDEYFSNCNETDVVVVHNRRKALSKYKKK